MRGPDFLRTKQFQFEPRTDVVNNIKLGTEANKTDDTNTSMAASATKPTKEPPLQIFLVDKFSSYQKLRRITAYILRLLISHECYRNIDSIIIDPTEFDEVQYIVRGESLTSERKISWKMNSLNGVAVLTRFHRSGDQMVWSLGMTASNCWSKSFLM